MADFVSDFGRLSFGTLRERIQLSDREYGPEPVWMKRRTDKGRPLRLPSKESRSDGIFIASRAVYSLPRYWLQAERR